MDVPKVEWLAEEFDVERQQRGILVGKAVLILLVEDRPVRRLVNKPERIKLMPTDHCMHWLRDFWSFVVPRSGHGDVQDHGFNRRRFWAWGRFLEKKNHKSKEQKFKH